MSLRTLALTALLVSLPLAGCILGEEEPGATVEPQEESAPYVPLSPTPTPTRPASPPPASTPPPANATAPTPDNGTQAPDAAPPAPVPTQVPVELSGTTGLGAEACAAATNCVSTGEVNADRRFAQDVRQGLQSYALVLEWTATTAATQTLRFGATFTVDGERVDVFVDGASPLVLNGAQAAQEMTLWVGMPPQGAPPAEAQTLLPQEFAVRGTLTVLDAPAA